MKNIKRMFFVLALVTLLATVGAVCAADDANSTAASDSSVSDVATVSDTVSDTVAEPVTSTSNDNKVDTKTIEKEEKNLKTSTQTRNYNDGIINIYSDTTILDDFYSKLTNEGTINYNYKQTRTVTVTNRSSLNSIINEAIQDTTNEAYIINLEATQPPIISEEIPGYYVYIEYKDTDTVNWYFNENSYVKDVTINGNNIKIESILIRLNNTNFHFKDLDIDSRITNYANCTFENCNLTYNRGSNGIANRGNITIKNCNLSTQTRNYNTGMINIYSDTTILDDFYSKLTNEGTINYNYNPNMQIKTVNVNNFDELTNAVNEASNDQDYEEYIINLQNGNYYTYETNWLEGTGNVKKITINGNNQTITAGDMNSVFRLNNGINFYFNDLIINTKITNYHNATFKNVVMGKYGAGVEGSEGDEKYDATFDNTANMTFINSTIIGSGNNSGILTISDDTKIEPTFFFWEQTGTINIDDMNRILHPDPNYEYKDENITEAITIRKDTNHIFTNCNITAQITNNGNLTLINCSLSNNDILSTFYDGKLVHNLGNATLINCSIMNNTLTTSYDGSLLYNLGDMNLTNCVVNNNTFNITSYSAQINGIVVNINHMTIADSLFSNNTDYTGIAYSKGSTIYNNGTLNIDNSNFTYNIAGKNGGSITSTNKLLNVNNSIFIGNKASSLGGAINGAGNITNSIFTRNYLEKSPEQQIGGGAVAGAENIINCTFDSNNVTCVAGIIGVVAHGGAVYNTANVIDSTFINNTAQNGAAIATRKLSFTSELNMYTIMNCHFENNTNKNIGSSGSIIYDSGYLYMKNNTFINNTDADYLLENPLGQSGYGGQTSAHKMNETINNNTFKDNKLDTDLFMILEPEYITATDNIYSNNTFNDTITLNIPEKIYAGEAITITGTYTINQASFYDTNILEQNQYNVYINGVLNQTLDEIEFTLTPTTGNMIVTVQPTISQTRKTSSLRSLTNVIITPENYNEYIYEGSLIGVGENSKITFQGTFTDKDKIEIDTDGITIDGTNATFTNTYLIIEANKVTISNMKINNTNIEYTITNLNDNNSIINNNITVKNTVGKTAAIYNTASNTLIMNNTLYVDGPAGDIDYDSGNGICTTQAILLLGGDNNNITQNTIKTTSTITSQPFGTIEGITNSNGATNTQITQNKIEVDGGRFNYAINSLNNVENQNIQENNITVTGQRYTCGIQIGDGAKNNNITKNNINLTCLNTTPVDEAAISYGIIVTSQGGQTSDNNNINENNITINGAVNYGMEIYTATNTVISDNIITLTGIKSMAIGFAHSPTAYIVANNITIKDDSTQPLNSITEEIRPKNVGIQIQQESNNIQIWYNNIKTYDKAEQDTCINIESNTATVKFNNLTSTTQVGNNAVKGQTDTIIENNTEIIQETNITTEDITTLTNTPTTLTATVTTTDGDNVNGGTVTFTDKEGNTIATATVNNGTATTTTTFKQAGENTITATYTPTSTGLTTSSTEATLTVKDKFQTTITIDEITATPSETITLKANILDENGEAVTGGKVTFKVNGKTIKDASGKVIYAKVVDGVATTQYTVPENLGGQDITVTAVYSGTTKYNKETTTITTTVTAPEAKLTITPITSDVQAGSTVTLKAKVSAGDKAITTGKIVFKVNGKTVKDANGKVIYAKVDANGEASVDYIIPESFKAGTYNIEAVFTAPGYEKLTDNTTMTVVKS